MTFDDWLEAPYVEEAEREAAFEHAVEAALRDWPDGVDPDSYTAFRADHADTPDLRREFLEETLEPDDEPNDD